MRSRPIITKAMKDDLPKECCNCGATENLTYHHIVPIIMGGNNVTSNIAVLCGKCHGFIHFDGKEIRPHGDLVKRGIKAAKERGVHVGKPCADYENVMRLICKYSTQFNDINDDGYVPYTEHEIMEMADVKPVCYAKCKRMLKEAMNSPDWPFDWEKPTVYKNRPMYEHCIEDIRSGKHIHSEDKSTQDLSNLHSISLISRNKIDSALDKATNAGDMNG